MARKEIRVLYIDDYPLDRALVRDALQESDLNFRISEATNQQEFFKLLSEDFELVLSDFNILGFTGLEVLEAVQEVSPSLPVIIVTGTGSEEVAAEAIKRGAADYVIKTPQGIHRLPLTIQSVLEKSQLKEEQRRAHQELIESEARYSQLVDTLQEGIWTIDDQGITTFVNPALAEMLGYQVNEMLGKHLFDFMDRQGKELAQQNLERRQQGESEQHDFIFLHKDGGRVHTNLVTSPVMDEEGKYQGAVAALRDISKEVEAEKALQDSRLQMQTLVENTPGSIWTLDHHYRLVSANSKFLDDLEKAFQKPIQRGYDLLSNINREEKREWKNYYDRSLQGEKFRIERQRRYGAAGKWFEYFFSPIRGERGEIRGVMVQAMDITNRKQAELSRAESTEKYRTLVNQVGSALFLHDMEGNLEEVNQQTVDHYGYSREELLSLTAGDIDPDYDDRSQGGEFWTDLFKQAPQHFKARHKRKDGTIFPVEVSINPITIKGKDYILALASDISDRLKTEREIAESEQKYRTLTEKSPAAIFETDPEGSCFYINAKWREISGLSSQEASGNGWLAGIHPGDRERIRTGWDYSIRTGKDWKQEYRFQDKTGRITWVQGEAVPLLDEEGKLRGYLGTNTIINDRKELENQLLETNRTLDALLANLPGMAFRCRNTPDWDMLFVSQGAQELSGFMPEELTDGMTSSFGDLIHPADQERVWDSIQQAFNEDRPYQIQYRIVRRDGAERWVQEQGVATKTDREGNVIELDGFIQDITERIQATRELESTAKTMATVLDSIDAHIYVSDLESYEILFMNEKMIRDFEGNLLGKKCYQAFRGKEGPCGECRISKLIDPDGNPGGSQSWEGRNEKTGRWYLNTDRAIPWTDRPLAHIQIAVDIHERKLAEKALQEVNQQLLLAQQIARIGNWSLDPQVGVPVWSDEIFKIYERDPEQGPLPLETYQNIYHGPYWELFNDSIQAAIQHGKPYDIQLQLELDSGKTKWVRAICQPDPDPGPAGHILQGTIQDITKDKSAEQALQESEERFRSSFENTQVGMALIDRQGRFLSVNQAACAILNYSEGELLKKTFLEITHPDSQERSAELFQSSLEDRQPYSLEKKYQARGGETVIGSTSVSPVFSDQGEFLYAVKHLIDITQEKLVEEEIRAQQEFYNQILSSVQDGIWVTNHNDRLIYFNPAMEVITGVDAEQMLGLSVIEDFPPETTEHFLTQYLEARQTGSPTQYETPVVTPAGRETVQAGWLIPRIENDTYQGMICTIQDVTEQHKNAQKLEESEAKFRSLFENLLDGFALHEIVLDSQGKPADYVYLEVNNAFEQLTGLEREKVIGRKVSEVIPGIEEDPANWIQKYGRVALTGEDLRLEQYSEPLDKWFSILAYSPAPGRFATVFEDITDQKQADQSLRESESRYRTLFESALEALVIHVDGRIVEVNQTFLEMYRCTRENAVGANPLQFTAPVSLDKARQRVETPSNRLSEFTAQRPDGSTFPILLHAKDITYQGQPARLVSIRDITRQKEMENALVESEARYRTLFNGMANQAVIFDQEARFQMINQAGVDNLGLSVEEILGKKLGDFFPANQDITVQRIQEVLGSGQAAQFEDQVELPDGRQVWYSIIMQPIHLPGETNPLVQSIYTDITERKEFEQRLYESEQLYRQLYQSSGVGVGYYTIDGKVISFNEIALRYLNLELDQVIGKSITELFPREQAKEYLGRIQQILASEARLEFEDRVELPTGPKWFLSIFSVIKDSQGEPLGIQIISLDITERKQLEEALQKSDFIINSTSDSVIAADPEGQITFWNPGAEQIYGYSADEALGKSVNMLYRDEDLPELENWIAELNRGKDPGPIDAINLNKDGQEVEVLLTLSTLRDNEGKATELVGITKDITPLRIAEQSLRLEKQRAQQYLDVAEIMLIALDAKGQVQLINPKGCEILGYSEEQILGKNWFDNFLDSSEIERVKTVHKKMISGEYDPVEYFENYIVRADGSRRLIAWHNSALKNEEGKIIGSFSSGEDITDRRQAELELQESKETAERYLNIAAEIILSLDKKGTITLLNPSGHQLLGYQPGELVGKNWFEVCLPKEEAQRSQNILSEMLAGETSKYDMVEGRVLTKQGELKDILWHNSLLRDEQGQATGTLSSGEDITRLTEIRDDLSYSKQLLINLSQAARQVQNLLEEPKIYQTIGKEIAELGFNTAIFSLSADETALELKYVSFQKGILSQASKIAGILPAEYQITLKPDNFFGQLLENHQTHLDIVSDQSLSQALPGLGKNILKRIVPLLDLEKIINAPLVIEEEVYGLLVVMGSELSEEDVPPIALFASQASAALRNARFAEALRQRTEELENLTALIAETEEAERKRLSRELHDQVGQSLALLGFNLNQVKDQLKKNAGLDTEKIESAQGILQEVTSGIRSVMDDLRPAILDDYGLQPALHWYTDKISEHSGMQIEVVGESLNPRLEKRKEVALFRITQEALTNITRHAQAAHVKLELSENQNLVTLTIADDGIGFDLLKFRDQENQAGWGLINMQERALRMGGKLTIETKENRGTKLIIQIPKE